ncbi:hypothetical protein KVR01_005776 [Diaporthe batatas]|uniref:uncharacterized protein n=1 Tax=Diaporthe batatas TaxID=748121 RepID=UPI001D038F17|nr:uncharacterized protein KVR01_005776 [Diaporthe batatas]KAG8163858.1 hypothetical protein KVR01_005776 [Diaporthe batatas]
MTSGARFTPNTAEMKPIQITALAFLVTAVSGWKLQWDAGININCQVYDSFTNFTVRVWEGQCDGNAAACNPSGGANYSSTATTCHDDIYNGGVITATENCEREIGRGAALMVSGCCQFFSSQDSCSGTPYLELAEGACEDPIQITKFTCSDEC